MTARFKAAGYKITPQRIAVFRFLDGNKSHPTAEDIFAALRREYPNISYTTVYNILKSMLRIGGIQELVIDRERIHYDPNTSLHHHALCIKCGKIIDVIMPVKTLKLPGKISAQFIPTSFQIYFYGKCRDCEIKDAKEK